MGKIFVTDEVNDMYTQKVTSAGKAQVETGAGTSVYLTSAHTTVSATSVSTSPVYLKSILMSYPATAATLMIYDTSVSAGNVSAFGTSGDNIKARLAFPIGWSSAGVSAGGVGLQPINIPLNVYLTSGLAYGIGGHSANDAAGYVGCLRGGVITYNA